MRDVRGCACVCVCMCACVRVCVCARVRKTPPQKNRPPLKKRGHLLFLLRAEKSLRLDLVFNKVGEKARKSLRKTSSNAGLTPQSKSPDQGNRKRYKVELIKLAMLSISFWISLSCGSSLRSSCTYAFKASSSSLPVAAGV